MISVPSPKPKLIILDVGHGNAAVLHDTHGVVVFDTGRHGRLVDYLIQMGITEIEALFLSHADHDHIAHAPTLLLHPKIRVKRIFLNTDRSKETACFEELLIALEVARRQHGTDITPQLTTNISGKIKCGDVEIEVLHPPPEMALAGVGRKRPAKKKLTSNAMCAAIRLVYRGRPVVLLAGDIEEDCIARWVDEKVSAQAPLLVFPHHGGAPGRVDPGVFCKQLAALVQPLCAIFSIHAKLHDLPRDDVVAALLGALPTIKLVCTQVPDKITLQIQTAPRAHWSLHYPDNHGDVTITFDPVKCSMQVAAGEHLTLT